MGGSSDHCRRCGLVQGGAAFNSTSNNRDLLIQFYYSQPILLISINSRRRRGCFYYCTITTDILIEFMLTLGWYTPVRRLAIG